MPDLWETAWQQVHLAVQNGQHPFRTPTFCSIALDGGQPHARKLVLRQVVGQSELWCYTDIRSQKVAEIARCPEVQWLFWDPKTQIQLSLYGSAHLLDSEKTMAIFQKLPKHSRKTYATIAAPATPLAQAGDGLPLNWEKAELSETNYAQENFCVLVCTLKKADLLQLNRDGNRRIQAHRNEEGLWLWQWVVP